MESLTDRETQVLALIVAGYTSKGIGDRLHISHRTVQHHRAAILRKLGAANTADLVRRAMTRKTRQQGDH